MVLCECGHPLSLHGRRGYGSCRHGRGGRIAAMVAAVENSVCAGLTLAERNSAVEEASKFEPCSCKRFKFKKDGA